MEDEVLQRRHKEKLERLQAIEDERQSGKEKRKQEAQIDQKESVSDFLRAFEQKKTDIVLSLSGAEEHPKEEVAALLERVAHMLTDLKRDTAKAALYLPHYERRQAKLAIDELSDRLSRTKATLLPKQRFRFKSRHLLKKREEEEKSQVVSTKPNKTLKDAKLNIIDRHNETICIKSGEVEGGDIWLSQLTDCTIYICDRSSAVRMAGLERCRIYVGPVAGSVHLEKATACHFSIASRQIRIHETRNCDFYLYVLSGPIIETCSELRFAPYNFSYERYSQHMMDAGLAADISSTDSNNEHNKWAQVEDFNWLRVQHSPNWCQVEEQNRKPTVTIQSAGELL